MKHDFRMLKLPFKKGEWCGADRRIFEACFQILGQFVEDELGPGIDPESTHRGYRLHSIGDLEPKAIDLWLWYRDDLPVLERDYGQDLAECYSGEFKTQDVGKGLRQVVDFGQVREPKFPHDWPEEVRDQKLVELMAIRQGLWT